MSFGCQLKLCRKSESESSSTHPDRMFCWHEFKAARAAGVGEDVRSQRNDWAVFRGPPRFEHFRPSSVRANASRNGVLAGTAIETDFDSSIGTSVADAGVRKKWPLLA